MLILDKYKNSIDTLSSSFLETDVILQKAYMTDVLKNTLRSGIIQNFEVTYELSWKFIKRWLEINETAETISNMSRRDLFRYAGSKDMIKNIELWFNFHAMRNESSHTYNENIILDIYKIIPDFITEAYFLYNFLDTHNE